MRRTRVALSTAAALIAAFGSNRAEAMVGAPQLSQAARSINPIEKTACWRLGWHGWGLYPCGYYYGGYPYHGYYGYGYPYYGYGGRPTWGWGGWGRRWWGWGQGAGAAIITIVSACRTRLRSRPQRGGTFDA